MILKPTKTLWKVTSHRPIFLLPVIHVLSFRENLIKKETAYYGKEGVDTLTSIRLYDFTLDIRISAPNNENYRNNYGRKKICYTV